MSGEHKAVPHSMTIDRKRAGDLRGLWNVELVATGRSEAETASAPSTVMNTDRFIEDQMSDVVDVRLLERPSAV